VRPGEIGLTPITASELGVEEAEGLTISPMEPPESLKLIRKKMKGEKLVREEIQTIIRDIVDGHLEELDVAAFLLAEHYCGMSMDEIVHLTDAMVATGARLQFDRPVYDKHSIGGVPGNKITLMIVPIVAAAGLLIPKTSSRAITSPAGTADTMGVLAPVEFTARELKDVVMKTGGAIAWGGALNLAPADDILIGVEYALQIDPVGQMLASIMSKKLAVGAENIVIDIPVGRGAKVSDMDQARELTRMFAELADRLHVRLRCAITYGGQPVGHAVGPALEAREALIALDAAIPTSLVEKSTAIAGLLLELSGRVSRGAGQDMAREVLRSGKALKKMREIIEAQGGEPNIKADDIGVGPHRAEIRAPCDGWVTDVSNEAITAIARAAGAPHDKGAGLIIHGKMGRKFSKGQPMIEIYAERESKLDAALSLASKLSPVTIEGMLLSEFPEY